MKRLLIILILFYHLPAMANINLSSNIYDTTAFSRLYSQQGALIQNVNYGAVNALKSQIENQFPDIDRLQDRGEAHITVITPPEAQGWMTKNIGVNTYISYEELFEKYGHVIQDYAFEVLCLGRQVNKAKGRIVFYLVVDSPQLRQLRLDVQRELEKRALESSSVTYFKADNWYPHITIGYIGGDVHGVSKGPETCVSDINIQ